MTNDTEATETTEVTSADFASVLAKFEELLPQIDAGFDEADIPISQRVLEAARDFLEAFHISIEGEPHPLHPFIMFRPVFGPFYEVASCWYERKYAAALKPDEGCIKAVFLIGRIPFLLDVPTTANRVEVPNETAWMIWPTAVRDNERPLTWVRKGPSFDAMPAHERQTVESNVRQTVLLVRTASINLMTVICPDNIASELSGQCFAHLEAAAMYLLDYRQLGNAGLALWEVHQSIEKALKLYIRQRGRTPRLIHEVRDLASDARNIDPTFAVDAALLAKMPTNREAILLRAGESAGGPLVEAFDTYRAALQLFVEITHQLKREFGLHDAAILLKKFPFV